MARPRPLRRLVQCLIAFVMFSGWLGSAQAPATWTPLDSTALHGIGAGVASLPDGGALIAGGLDNPTELSHFVPDWNSWTSTSMGVARISPAVAVTQSGHVLIAGGRSGTAAKSTVTRSIQFYDPAAFDFLNLKLQTMLTERYGAVAVTLSDGRVLIAGGANNTGDLTSAELINLTSQTRQAAGSMAGSHTFGTAQLLDNGKVLIVGGTADSTAVASAEIYDPGTDSWSAAPSMVFATNAPASVRLADGSILVVGGDDLTLPGGQTYSQIYNPGLNVWSKPLLVPDVLGLGDFPRLALRGNGFVLAAGRTAASAPAAAMFDPDDFSWSPVAVPGTVTSQIVQVAPLIGARTLVVELDQGLTHIVGPDTTTAPTANAGADQTFAGCQGCLIPVTLDASGSTDPEEDQKDYIWKEGTTTLATTRHPITAATVLLPVGVHQIELTVSDWQSAESTDTVTVTINDTVGDLGGQIAQCQGDVAALTAEIAGLNAQLAAAQGELNTANALNAQLAGQVAALQSEIQILNGTIASLSAQVAALQLDLAGAANTIAALNAQIADLTAQNSALAAQLAPLQTLVDQFAAPGPQVASAIVAVGALIPAAPTSTARNRLLSAQNSLTSAGFRVAAFDLIDGLNKVKAAVSQLSSTPLATLDTVPIRQSLSLGVRAHLQRAMDDVTALAGAGHENVVAAAGHLAGGDADHAAGNYLGAIEKYVLAFKQLAMI